MTHCHYHIHGVRGVCARMVLTMSRSIEFNIFVISFPFHNVLSKPKKKLHVFNLRFSTRNVTLTGELNTCK